VSPPPVPTLGAGTAAVFRLQWRRLVRGKKLRLGSVAVGLVVLAVTAARYAQEASDPTEVMRAGTQLGFFTMLAFLVPFLLTSGAIAEEVESRTLAYLSSRPVARLGLTLGKYLAGVVASVLLLAGGLLLMHVATFLTVPGSMIDELPTTLRAASALTLLALLYGAICMFWGAVATEAAGIVSALYLAIVEFAFSFLPGIFRLASMNYLAQQLAGLPKAGLHPELVPEVAPWVPFAAIVPMGAGFLLLAALVVATSEYRFGKA
jgi:ABC-type transport system involved in multi-copper enzyme maturation permease subunit